MSNLDNQGQSLLDLLVSRLREVVPGRPETYIAYKDIHDALNLELLGPTYGESLKHQGLNSLADWTKSEGKPAISGIIIDRGTLMPGGGYFRLFGRSEDDFGWWTDQVQLSKDFDWLPCLSILEPPETPQAADFPQPPERQQITTYRILRDSNLARRVKLLHEFQCQFCGYSIVLPDGSRYAEAHHIRPLGDPHSGPDVIENIACLCPNHHAELDYGVRTLASEDLRVVPGHSVGDIYLRYHNEVICKQN
jgi:hypothetical protein